MSTWNRDNQEFVGNGNLIDATTITDRHGNVLSGLNSIEGGVAISNGDAVGKSYVNKFGYHPNVVASWTTVASQGSYVYPTTPGVCTVTSSDSNDNGGTVLVSGLDTDYNEISEVVTVGSSGILIFARVYRAALVTCNTGTSNVGNIDITLDSSISARLPIDHAQTLQCAYTVPAGKTAFLTKVYGSASEKDRPVHFALLTRDTSIANAAFNTRSYVVTQASYVEHNLTIPERIPEKYDIELRAKSTPDGIEVAAGFDLVLVDNITYDT